MKEGNKVKSTLGYTARSLCKENKSVSNLVKVIPKAWQRHGLIRFYSSNPIAEPRKSEVSKVLMILHCPHVCPHIGESHPVLDCPVWGSEFLSCFWIVLHLLSSFVLLSTMGLVLSKSWYNTAVPLTRGLHQGPLSFCTSQVDPCGTGALHLHC